MDLPMINLIISLVSAAAMFFAIVFILVYVLGSFSSRSGTMSVRFVLSSLLYFFGSTAIIFAAIEWLNGLSRDYYIQHLTGADVFYLNIGASALALNAVLNIFCGALTALMYMRGKMS
jgi:hypothetical protein